MARPKSEDKRNAILAAAARVIVTHGLSASTAMIAQEAGVSNGSLFTYFETKADLLNQLYIGLKAEMASVAMSGFPEKAKLRDQAYHIWANWMRWAVGAPACTGAAHRLRRDHPDELCSRAQINGQRCGADGTDPHQRPHA